MYGNGYNYNQGGGGYGYDQMQAQQGYGYGAVPADAYGAPADPQAGGFGYDQYAGYGQAQMPMYDSNGYPTGEQMPMQENPQAYNQNYDAQGGEDMVEEQMDMEVQTLKSSKSFTGPPDGKKLGSSASVRKRSMTNGKSAGGLARNGSVFRMNRERDTQHSVSVRGGFDAPTQELGEEELAQYYGDMSKRNGEQRFDGFRATKSYRGTIDDGEDIGKPRRVTNSRNLQGKGSTGYGGLNFKRQCAMRKGENWGDVDVRRRETVRTEVSRGRGTGFNKKEQPDDSEERRRLEMEDYNRRMMEAQMMQQPPPMMMMDQPAVPHVFNQEDVHSYSNLSDAFAEDAMQDEEGDF